MPRSVAPADPLTGGDRTHIRTVSGWCGV